MVAAEGLLTPKEGQVAKRRRGGEFVLGLIVLGMIVSVFSDDKSSTSTMFENANTPHVERPSINPPIDTSLAEGIVGSGKREVPVSGNSGMPQGDQLASVSPKIDTSVDTLPFTPKRIVYSTVKLRMREGPGPSFPTITTLDKGARLEVLATDGQWLRVTASLNSGWVHGEFVSDGSVSIEKPAIKQETAPARRLVRKTPETRSGQPIRDSYVGTCDCPYDLMSNGRRCGGRSAYSRPGGRSPQCYF
ncbi:SH3 domain-containing protein [Rhizobium sullae]|uniref:SH3 domain-containing protein n=1 Tax=Rhizobium sullae TaxID=50338 RepID=A0A4R3Q903_RHISU|nr:SH3 domain-containing protein [Rhizobium sullae]TCU17893.1 SH3 domain-containing protein [Rhizobium sullae]